MPEANSSTLDRLLLVASFLLLAVLVGAMFWSDAGTSDGATVRMHPDHPGMLQATGPVSPTVVAWGLVAGLAILLLMTVCTLIGVRKAGTTGPLGRRLIWGCAGLALLFTALVWTYHAGRGTDPATANLVGGFPAATAWMIYGIWWFPALMLLTLVHAFSRTWLTEDDVESFRKLLDER